MVSTKFSLAAIALASALSASAMKVVAGSPAAQALTRHNTIAPVAGSHGPGYDSRPGLGKTPRTGGGKSGAKPHSQKPGHSSRPGNSKPSRSGGKPAARPLGPGVDVRPNLIKTKGTVPTRNIIKRGIRASHSVGAKLPRPLGPGVDARPNLFKTPTRNIIKRSVRTSGPAKTASGGTSKLFRLAMNTPLIHGITPDYVRGPRVLKHRELVEEILEELERRELELDELE